MNVAVDDLKLLLPDRFISYKDKLFESVKFHNVLSPIVMAAGVVCDGQKRVVICKKLGIKNIPVVNVKGNPIELFFYLNDRDFDINTLALLLGNLSDSQIAVICKNAGLSDSPQMIFAIRYLHRLLNSEPELIQYQLPANIWRELGHLGDDIGKYAKDLLKLKGTVGEKRNIVGLLRQAQRRGELPGSLMAEKAIEIIPSLQKTAQPRRTEAYEKYEKALGMIGLPIGVDLKIDPTFAQPGVNLSFSVKRSELDKLDSAKVSLEKLFEAVPEL